MCENGHDRLPLAGAWFGWVSLLMILLSGCAPRPDPGQDDVGLRDLAGAQLMHIGTAAEAQPVRTDPQYARLLAEEFNLLSTENAFKMRILWPDLATYRFADTDFLVDFAEQHAMRARGHTLIWHEEIPDWLIEGDYSRDELIDILRDHVTTVVSRYRGQVESWDVVNEAVDGDGQLRQSFFWQVIGPEYIDFAFRWAAEADPDALLFYNENGAEGLGAKSDGVYHLIQSLIGRGVPVHGVGLQMHTTIGAVPDAEAVRRNMSRLEQLGVQVQITEMDVRLNDAMGDLAQQLELQAAAYRTMAALCLQHRACTAFITWGFTDRNYARSGRPDKPLLFDANYVPKPAYTALFELLRAS